MVWIYNLRHNSFHYIREKVTRHRTVLYLYPPSVFFYKQSLNQVQENTERKRCTQDIVVEVSYINSSWPYSGYNWLYSRLQSSYVATAVEVNSWLAHIPAIKFMTGQCCLGYVLIMIPIFTNNILYQIECGTPKYIHIIILFVCYNYIQSCNMHMQGMITSN